MKHAMAAFLFPVSFAFRVANMDPAQLSRYDGDMKPELSAINEDDGKYLVLNSKFSTSTQKE
jgi:hypothetical protein